MATLALLVQVALRNLFKSWVNLIIGFIILFATTLVVAGGAFLDSLDASMSRSIIGSVAGHLQVYSDESKDELALFGGNMGDDPDLAPVDSFAPVKALLEKHPNVKEVVPMGSSGALITSGNTVDLTLARLRAVHRQLAQGGSTPELRAQAESLEAHVRRLAGLLQADLTNRRKLLREEALDPGELEALERTQSPAFWEGFEADPFGRLEYLENKLAPQAADGDLLFIRYVGTDLGAFQRSFDRMEVVDGQAVPPGERGMLLSKFFYEEFLKLKTARRLDKIKEALETGRRTIATDPELQRFVKENVTQTREIAFQLDPAKAQEATRRLQRLLGSQEQDLERLLAAFLATDDASFAARYEQFYAELVPLLELYRLRPGDSLTISAFTKTGYVESLNVRIWGTFRLKGLEKSPLAGFINLMDLISFRELYGHLSSEAREEVARMKAESGAKALSREDAESALFGEGGGATLTADATAGLVDVGESLPGAAGRLAREEARSRVYTQEDIDQGMMLSAAVILKDPEALSRTLRELADSPEVKAAGLRVVSWQQAAGLMGQLVSLMRWVLWGFVLILCLVTLAVINNAMMMATLRRVREVGTMRAIGAQRSFILAMVLLETLVLGLVFGGLGAGVGSGVVALVDRIGIPAVSDEMYFFFSGPRLHLFLSPDNILNAFVLVTLVSAFSTFYPAWLATRVAPVVAMQTEE